MHCTVSTVQSLRFHLTGQRPFRNRIGMQQIEMAQNSAENQIDAGVKSIRHLKLPRLFDSERDFVNIISMQIEFYPAEQMATAKLVSVFFAGIKIVCSTRQQQY